MTLELINEDNDLEALGGMVGALNLFDSTPRINPARVRPFVWSVLLLRGAVRLEEVLSSITPHAHPDDIRSWEDEDSVLTIVIRSTLAEMVKQNILRQGRDDLYVLSSTPEAARTAISVTSTLNGQLPDHMLAEMGRAHYERTS